MGEGLALLLSGRLAIVGLWFLAFFVGERLRPAALPPPSLAPGRGTPASRRLLRNGGLWVINSALSPLLILPLTIWASSQSLDWRPAWWSGWGGLLFDILLLDFLIYWWHRANHEIPFLWRFHEVHHRDQFLDATSALRFHLGELLLSGTARAAVIWLLGFPLASILVFESLVLMAAIFHHSNLRLSPAIERQLSRLFITPAIHWLHHHARRADTDSNYGTILAVWDSLFGSRNQNSKRLDMPIGVEGRRDLPLFKLLLLPFRGSRQGLHTRARFNR